ncbi:MAG TPA: aminoglycoside phosphotransferase [Pseudonocardiaceae bacterium]|jgi:maltokinase
MAEADLVETITEALRVLLPEQRWFAGKGRPVHGVRALRTTELSGPDPALIHAVVEVDQGEAQPDRYQLLLGARGELPDSLGHAWVAATGDRAVYQAEHDPELTSLLLGLMAEGVEVGGLRFTTEPGATLDTGLRSRPVGADQSNTSLVFGQTYILKLFRKVDTGRSPDLELHRALAARGCKHIATPLGSIEGDLDEVMGPGGGDSTVTYGMLTEYLRGTADGWAMATTSVRDLLAEDMRADGSTTGVEHPHPEDVGGDFASEAHRLGQAVATVHADLAAALGSTPAPDGYLDTLADEMHEKLDQVLAQVPELGAHEPALRATFDAVRDLTAPVPLQRVHGDLHLGQVLRSVTGWVLIDFEGEPMAPLAQRVAPASPLRDVAGMLRSFDYAANHLPLGDADPQQRAVVALEWTIRNQDAFCDGYAQVASDPREQHVLLRAFELSKAVYEVGYENGNRPTWLQIPMEAIARLTTDPAPEQYRPGVYSDQHDL